MLDKALIMKARKFKLLLKTLFYRPLGNFHVKKLDKKVPSHEEEFH